MYKTRDHVVVLEAPPPLPDELPLYGGFENNCSAVMRSSSEEGLYLRLVDFFITQL